MDEKLQNQDKLALKLFTPSTRNGQFNVDREAPGCD